MHRMTYWVIEISDWKFNSRVGVGIFSHKFAASFHSQIDRLDLVKWAFKLLQLIRRHMRIYCVTEPDWWWWWGLIASANKLNYVTLRCERVLRREEWNLNAKQRQLYGRVTPGITFNSGCNKTEIEMSSTGICAATKQQLTSGREKVRSD